MREKLLGLTAVLGAFGAGFCCIAPAVIASLGVGTLTSLWLLRNIVPYRDWLFGMTIVALIAGYAYAWRRKGRFTRLDWAMLGLSTVVAFSFLAYTISIEGLPRFGAW